MADSSLALELNYVEKRYGRKVHALKGVSLNVRRGEVFGLLGPNGAGKSTLVKIIMTVVRPTRAEGFVLGEPVATKAALRRVGYLPENHRFPRYLTGRQTLDFFAALSGAPRTWRRKRIPELLEVVGMAEWADRKVSEYSKGMSQRIGIAQALAADPDLIVLDEPTDGVDPVGRRDIRDLLLRLKGTGKAVFINSHLLSELEMICDRVAIMVAGQVARQGTLDELAVSRRAYEIEIVAEKPAEVWGRVLGFGAGGAVSPPGGEIPFAVPAGVGGTGGVGVSGGAATGGGVGAAVAVSGPPPLPGAIKGGLVGGLQGEITPTGSTLRVFEPDPNRIQDLIDRLRAAGVTVRRVQPIQPTLEHLFMEAVAEVTGGSGYAAGARIG